VWLVVRLGGLALMSVRFIGVVTLKGWVMMWVIMVGITLGLICWLLGLIVGVGLSRQYTSR